MAAQPQQQPVAKPDSVASPAVSAPATQPPSAPQIVSDIPKPPTPQPVPPIHTQPSQHNQPSAVNSIAHHQPPAPRPLPPFATVPSQAPPTHGPSLQGPAPRAVVPPGYSPYDPAYRHPGPPLVHPHVQLSSQVQGRANIDHNAAMRRPVIMDPPKRVEPPVDGFASPEHDHARENPRFVEDRQRLAFAIDQSQPASVRRVIRDNWEKCLLGSDFHQAFVTNATIHHVTPAIFQRAVRDFGNKMVGYGKRELIEHFSMYDLEELSDIILSKVSNNFLDKAMAKRLKTIEAKPLINALARAERLGYEPSDIVEETPTGRTYPQERVVSAQPVPTAQAVPQKPGVLQCELCGFVFPGPAAKEHHVKKMVCNRQPKTPGGFKFTCQYCGQGFSTIVGLQYVCGDYGQHPKDVGTRNNPVAIPSGNSTPTHAVPVLTEQARSGGSTSGYKEWSLAQRVAEKGQTTPGPPSSQPGLEIRSVTPSSTPSGTPGDPYAHLTPAQMAAMQEELRQAEIKYGDRLRQAQALVDDAERKTRLDALGNSYGTKQSMIRKKYGVRLRTRRTKAEIEAEKERISITKEPSPAKTSSQARPSAVAVTGEKRRESGWVAANTGTPPNDYANGHDAKRQRSVQDDQRSAQEALARGVLQYTTPHPHAPIVTPSKIRGPATAIASLQDVDMADAPVRPAGSDSSARNSGASGSLSKSATPGAAAPTSTAPGQVAVEGGSSASDSDSNEDIPAALPPSVRQNLPPQPPPRPGSS